MLAQVWVRNEGAGFLDGDARDGDVLMTFPDSFEASLGTQDKKSFLIVKIPDPPNMSAVQSALAESEYALGATPEDVVVRRYRKYTLAWRSKFTAGEIEVIEDSTAMLPDGQLSSGGTVSSGVVSNKFTIADFLRK